MEKALSQLLSKELLSFPLAVAVNFKQWEQGREVLIKDFLLCSNFGRRLQQNSSSFELIAAGEELGTFEGSGCAMFHVIDELLSALDRRNHENSQTHSISSIGPMIGLLAAGEGSRLWGVSASCGFIKALLQIFSRSLLEISLQQCVQLIAPQLPDAGADYLLLSGTDNVLLPSSWPLKTVSGDILSHLREKDKR